MISLPACRYRADSISGGRYLCQSPKIVSGPNGVPASTCQACPYADDASPPAGLPVELHATYAHGLHVVVRWNGQHWVGDGIRFAFSPQLASRPVDISIAGASISE